MTTLKDKYNTFTGKAPIDIRPNQLMAQVIEIDGIKFEHVVLTIDDAIFSQLNDADRDKMSYILVRGNIGYTEYLLDQE